MNHRTDRKIKIRKSWIITPVVAVILGVIGVAGASVIATDGTAKITGKVGTLQAVTGIAPAGSYTGDLWPGHSNNCTVSITNPNSVDVKITNLHAVGINVVSADGTTQVFEGDPSVAAGFATFPDIAPVNFIVGANTTNSYAATNCISLSDQDDTSYQGDSIATHYSVTFQSN